jgi:predicted transcriptional regulator
MGFSQRDAAKVLDLSPRVIAYYESGEREITRVVALACAALENGLQPAA